MYLVDSQKKGQVWFIVSNARTRPQRTMRIEFIRAINIVKQSIYFYRDLSRL